MTVRELREKMEGVPEYYEVDVLSEYNCIIDSGDVQKAVEAHVYTNDMTLTIVI